MRFPVSVWDVPEEYRVNGGALHRGTKPAETFLMEISKQKSLRYLRSSVVKILCFLRLPPLPQRPVRSFSDQSNG
jgi:hypothetical protein